MTKQMCRIKDQIFCVGNKFYTKSAKRNNLWYNKHERFEKYLMFNFNNLEINSTIVQKFTLHDKV